MKIQHLRDFLIRNAGLKDEATDDDVRAHFDRMSGEAQARCIDHCAAMEAQERDGQRTQRSAAADGGDVVRATPADPHVIRPARP